MYYLKNVCRLITWELYRPSTTGEGESRDVREQRFSDYLHQIVTETEAAARVTIDSKDVNEDESVSAVKSCTLRSLQRLVSIATSHHTTVT